MLGFVDAVERGVQLIDDPFAVMLKVLSQSAFGRVALRSVTGRADENG